MLDKMRTVIGGLLVAAGGSAFASAAHSASSTGNETLTMNVASAISLTLDQTTMAFKNPSNSTTVAPGDVVTATGSMTVKTNNATGYTITLASATATMTSGTTSDTVPVSTIQWKNSSVGTWPGSPTTLSTTPQTLATSATVTAGTSVGHDLRIPSAPWVAVSGASSTYSVTLNVVASTNA